MLQARIGTLSKASTPWGHDAAILSTGTPPNPMSALESVGVPVKVRRGSEVFADGDEAAFCYKIVAGNARAVKIMSDGRRQIYEFLLPGDFFGFDLQGARSFSVEAITDLTVMKYPRRSVEQLMLRNAAFAAEIQRITARGLHSAYQRMLLLTHKSADERIAWFLLNMAERSRASEEAPIHLAMNRTDIADYLGMVIETVSRALTRLKQTKLIAMQGINDVRLVDRDRLQEVCGEF